MVPGLKNKVFISTRPQGKSSELHHLLIQNKAIHYELPMIELKGSTNIDLIDDVLTNIKTFTHLAFTSANGFEFFYNNILKYQGYKEILNNIKITSIGFKTTETIKTSGLEIDFDAKAKTGREFAEKLKPYLLNKNATVLWPTGNLSPDILNEVIGDCATLTRLNIYQNIKPQEINEALISLIKNDNYDMIICSSPSAFQNLTKTVESKTLKIACIGETTASAVLNHGITPLCIAKEPNAIGIFNAISEYFNNI